MKWLSKDVEELIAYPLPPKIHDAVVVGSGYGGAVSTLRLAEAGIKVLLLERGEEWLSEEFPNDLGNAFSAVRIERMRETSSDSDTAANAVTGYESALFDLRLGTGVGALVGNGLGGTSLINANVVIEPDLRVFDKVIAANGVDSSRYAWPASLRTRLGQAALSADFAKAKIDLGAEQFKVVDLWSPPDLNGNRVGVFAEPQKLTRLREFKDALTQQDEVRSAIRIEPAWLTVNLGTSSGTNLAPRSLGYCIGCGDCVSGCNQNAKKSLDTTYLTRAYAAGASMFTGVSVLKVEQVEEGTDDKPHWIIHYVQTRARGKLRNSIPIPSFQLHARHVILSAGTFGSTEILMRSESEQLPFSPSLGHRFSTNGDAIAFGYGLKKPVNGIGSGATHWPGTLSGVGPTITANLRIDHPDDLGKSVLIQDAVIPGAIASLFHEGISCLATFAQLDEWKFRGESPQTDSPRGTIDWAVLQTGGLKHTQTLLAMGHDKSAGSIRLDKDRDRLVMVYPGEAGKAVHERQEQFLQQMTAQGAVYIQNPVVSPLPPKVSNILSGSAPGNASFTVHPLGGCCMADEVAHGVVNEHGRVFRPGTSGYWQGLYVLDGSIIPSSLGANPLLAITALAERAMAVLAPGISANRSNHAASMSVPPNPRNGWPKSAPDILNTPEVKLNFTESMRGEITWLKEPRQAHLLLHLPVDDLSQFWLDGEHRIVIPNQLERERDDKEEIEPRLRLDQEDEQDGVRKVVATQSLRVISGDISILPVPTPNLLQRLSLWLRTVLTWFLDRGFHELLRLLVTEKVIAVQRRITRFKRGESWFSTKTKTDSPNPNGSEYVKSFLKFANHASESRVMRYRLVLRDDHAMPDGHDTSRVTPPFATFHLLGTKQIGYAASWGAIFWKIFLPFSYMERTNVWKSLGEMQVEIDDDSGNRMGQGVVNLDLLDMSRMHAPQLGLQRDTPNALLALLGYPMWFMRLLIKTRIWDFRLPDYPETLPIEFDPNQGKVPDSNSDEPTLWPPEFPPLRVYLDGSTNLTNIRATAPADLKVQRSRVDTSEIDLRLTRYKQPNVKSQTLVGQPMQAKVLLMLNGFAQSTLGFVPQEHKRWPSLNGKTLNGEIDEPGLAEFFYEQGFDIWLFDYRTSSILEASKLPCTMDDIAEFDIPAAVDHVLKELRVELNLCDTAQIQIYAFAHCVGAASLAMSLLGGYLTYPKRNPAEEGEPIIGKLAGITLSQMQAYLVGSETAQLRLQAGGILRDTLGIDYLRLSAAERKPTPLESVLDRLFASLPVDAGEHCPHESARYIPRPGICTCKRMSGTISRLLKHDMIKEETHDRLPIYFGRANTSLLVHGGRCVENERLVNADGQNIYVTDANIAKYLRLPIAILHGQHNALFDVESAHRTFSQISRVNFDLISPQDGIEPAYDLIIAKDYAHFDCTIGFGKPMQEQILKPLNSFYDKAWKLGGHLPIAASHSTPRVGEVRSEGKAPLAGPIMGWSRLLGNSKQLIRFWIEVDESESDLAKYAVTVVRSMRLGYPIVSAQLWPIQRVPLEFVPGRDPKDLAVWPPESKAARVAIALADLEFPLNANPADYRVQMFSVHEFWFNKAVVPPAPVQPPNPVPGSGQGHKNPVPPAPNPNRPQNPFIGRPITPEELEESNRFGELPGRGTVPAQMGEGFTSIAEAIAGSTPLSGKFSKLIHFDKSWASLVPFAQIAPSALSSPKSYKERIGEIGSIAIADALVLVTTLAKRESDPEEEARRGKPVTVSRDRRHLRPIHAWPFSARVLAALLKPKDAGHSLRFLATCCRHPGLGFEDRRADASFERMAELLQSDPENHRDCLVLLGDQIYADSSYGLIDNPSPIERITLRHRKAFNAKGFNRVSTQLPTYMVFDDHEIVDLWSVEERFSKKAKLRQEARKLFATATASFAAYQWAHGPRNSSAPGFNYRFTQAGFSFFALDTRTQRRRFSKPPTICTSDQLDELTSWLSGFGKNDTAPKFIMTGSLLAPGLVSEQPPRQIANPMAESWQMAPEQRAEVLRNIAMLKVKNVVFLSGDIHCDATAELSFSSGLKAYAIVTPPLYAPLPGANSRPSDVLKQEIIDIGQSESVAVTAVANEGSGFTDIHVTPLPANQWLLSMHFYRIRLEDKEPKFRSETKAFLLT